MAVRIPVYATSRYAAAADRRRLTVPIWWRSVFPRRGCLPPIVANLRTPTSLGYYPSTKVIGHHSFQIRRHLPSSSAAGARSPPRPSPRWHRVPRHAVPDLRVIEKNLATIVLRGTGQSKYETQHGRPRLCYCKRKTRFVVWVPTMSREAQHVRRDEPSTWRTPGWRNEHVV